MGACATKSIDLAVKAEVLIDRFAANVDDLAEEFKLLAELWELYEGMTKRQQQRLDGLVAAAQQQPSPPPL